MKKHTKENAIKLVNKPIKTLISRPFLRSGFILTAVALTCAAFASAATIPVTNTDDSGPGSLRAALASAANGDTIDATGISGAILLTSGELLVDKSVTINGPGAANLAVNGNATSRVFHVGSVVSPTTVTIAGLTITNGSAGWASGEAGGGIVNDHADLTLSNCTVSGNWTAGLGGGVYSGREYGSATLTLNNCTFSRNSAQWGGGIFSDGFAGSATLTVTNSTISGNSAFNGGGIFSYGEYGSATLTVSASTLSGNSASDLGGGILNDSFGGSTTLSVSTSTISGNSAFNGGGIFNDGLDGSATLTLNNSTFSGNSAFNGGGIYNYSDDYYGSATLDLTDTILNAGASGENIFNVFGTVTSHGYNLSSDNGGGLLTATGDQINTDPKLGPLQDNGGPTFTHELLSGSPAIDAGDPNFTPPPEYDQRGPGYDRVVNGRIDIGSFEVQGSMTVCPQPQGYWKNNPDAWPVNSLALGSQSYLKTELLIILNTSIGSGKNADASLILADQLIAAKLNVANGSDPAPVSSTITHADSLLSGFSGKLPYAVKTSSANGQAMVNDATVLESYNNGALTPGCTP